MPSGQLSLCLTLSSFRPQLTEMKCCPKLTCDNGYAPIHEAARNASASVLKAMLECSRCFPDSLVSFEFQIELWRFHLTIRDHSIDPQFQAKSAGTRPVSCSPATIARETCRYTQPCMLATSKLSRSA